MQVFVFVTVLLTAVCWAASVKKRHDLNDTSSLKNEIKANRIRTIKSFVSIVSRPPPVRVIRPDQIIALTCEAIAMPAPSIRWYKNNQPTDNHDLESNEVLVNNPKSIATVISTLIVKQAGKMNKYTCVTTAGQKTAKSSTVVYSTDGSTDISERTRLQPLGPRIVGYYKSIIIKIGNDLVLPCRAKGHPRPHITWFHNDDNLIVNDRIKVLRSGDLAIKPLLWSDVGDFTCQASNIHGSQNITTFVYPTVPS